jgi:ornithine carbamoyltransferase
LAHWEFERILELALQIKANPQRFARALEGRYLSLLFEKPSLRTRLTFELAIKQLGGDAVAQMGPIAEREPIKDVARNLERWTHCIVARVFSQHTVDQLAEWASIPVINALSDRFHPCQALADMQTLRERFGRLKGLKLVFVGDANNVAHSLMLCAARAGMEFVLSSPPGVDPDAATLAAAQAMAVERGASIELIRDPRQAVNGAHAVYTDVWASMGQEHEAQQRRQVFQPYQVTADLMRLARPEAVFLHCLPAHRGEEATDAVLESPASVVFDQAENRLHAQKALLVHLLS